MPGYVQRFLNLNRTEGSLFIQACVLSIIYSLYIGLIPMRYVFKNLGEKDIESSFDSTDNEFGIIIKVEKAIRRVVRYLPWKTKCFVQAITAKRMLQRKKIKSTIYLGVAKEEKDKMIAHAWLRSGNTIVTGKEEMQKFTPIVFFT